VQGGEGATVRDRCDRCGGRCDDAIGAAVGATVGSVRRWDRYVGVARGGSARLFPVLLSS
jgi:hypothetical protein